MPAELPGFYWDETRNRYFPLSSKPKQPPPPAGTTLEDHGKGAKVGAQRQTDIRSGQKRKRSHVPWDTSMSRLLTNSYTQTLQDMHELLCFHYASSSRMTKDRVPTFGFIQAFCSTHVGQEAWRFIGDDQGWLYSEKSSRTQYQHGINYWSADLNLEPSSAISSICTSGFHCVSTSLGLGKISVQNMSNPERTYLLNLNQVFDIWASDLQDQTLVLGANKKAVYISDIDVTSSPEYLHTGSDVFSVIKNKTLVYAGTRNGSVERFDMRMPKHKSRKLFDNRFKTNPRSSALHLNIIRDHELLISHMNGDLLTFDLRFVLEASESPPVKVFDGHVNTHMRNLGIAVDHDRDLLFAAGQDCRIRGWSLRTGARLLPPMASTNTQGSANPFWTTFSQPVCALQVTEEFGDPGVSLWAASGRDLHQFHLGQRGIV